MKKTLKSLDGTADVKELQEITGIKSRMILSALHSDPDFEINRETRPAVVSLTGYRTQEEVMIGEEIDEDEDEDEDLGSEE